jgi:hypothetical protein
MLARTKEVDDITCAILARITPRLYLITLDRSLLAAMNVLTQKAGQKSTHGPY